MESMSLDAYAGPSRSSTSSGASRHVKRGRSPTATTENMKDEDEEEDAGPTPSQEMDEVSISQPLF